MVRFLGGYSNLQMACEHLGIRVIKACSPQAKGRVERNHAVYQDRLVKALKLSHIKTIKEANKFLENGFVDELNQKFSKQAINPISAHQPLNKLKLNDILCWRYERKLQHDFTFSFNKHIYQIEKHPGDAIKPRVKLDIRKHLDNTISAWYQDKELNMHMIDRKEKPEVVQRPKDIRKNIKRLLGQKQIQTFLNRILINGLYLKSSG